MQIVNSRMQFAIRTGLQAFLLVVLLTAVALAADLAFPPLTGRVVDNAGILSPTTDSELTQLLKQQEQTTGDQVVVLTLSSLEGHSIEDFGYQLGRHWGIGQAGKNNGVLLIVAPHEHKVRIEVGYGLEGQLTDASSRIIIERDILPAFRQGDFDAGVLSGTRSILKVLGNTPGAQSASGWGASSHQLYQGATDWMVWLVITLLLFWMLPYLLIYMLGPRYHSGKDLLRRTRRTAYRNRPFGLPPPFYGGGYGGGGSFGGGGGGFSGGGGSFGGGGASGGW